MNLALNNVSKKYGLQWALKNLCLECNDIGCLALIGPSGGGKSTALRLLAGLEATTSGSISVNGKPLAGTDKESLRRYRKSIGIVFQAYNLFPHLDALTNIVLPLEKVHGFDRQEAIDKGHNLLAKFKLEQHSSKRPSELSGGQNQRVAIARALASDPDLIMMDEPTSALDPEMTWEVLEVIDTLLSEGKEAVIVTHEMGFARQAAQRVAFIAEGRVVESESAEKLFNQPANTQTQRFLGKVLKY